MLTMFPAIRTMTLLVPASKHCFHPFLRWIRASSFISKATPLATPYQEQISSVHPTFLKTSQVLSAYPDQMNMRYSQSSKLHTSVPNQGSSSKALIRLSDLKELKSSPTPALVLGLSGLIPFIVPPMLMISSQTFMPFVALTQVSYGAVILSFLGGIHWGLALPENGILRPDWRNLGWSITPSLVACAALLMSTSLSLLTLTGGLALSAYYDMISYALPIWFKALRFVFSFVAVIALWTTLVLSFIYGHSEQNKEKQNL